MAWSQVCGPSCDSWVLDSSDARLRRPDTLASGRTLSFCFVAVDFFLGRLFGLGLVGRFRASVPTFFWWCSPSLVLGFAWRLWPLGGPGTCYFLGPYLGFFPLASIVGLWLEVVKVYPWLSSLRSFAVEVVTLVSLSGACWLALVALLCLWTPGSCGVPNLHVRSPISCPVCVLPQSTIVTLLSLLWLGLLLVFVRFHYLRLTLWASACVGPHDCPAFFTGRCCAFNLDSSSLAWLRREPSTVFLLLCLPSGCGHPLGSLVSFVTIDRQRRFPLEEFSLVW